MSEKLKGRGGMGGMSLLGGFDDGVGRHDHENAIGEDGDDDEEREERMNEDEDGHPSDRVERGQEPDGARGAEPVNVFPSADHYERLCKEKREKKREKRRHHHPHHHKNPSIKQYSDVR